MRSLLLLLALLCASCPLPQRVACSGDEDCPQQTCVASLCVPIEGDLVGEGEGESTAEGEEEPIGEGEGEVVGEGEGEVVAEGEGDPQEGEGEGAEGEGEADCPNTCALGTYCVAGECVFGCSSDTHCEDPLICSNNSCVECDNLHPCTEQFATCSGSGKCIAPQCSNVRPCDPGQHCELGTCKQGCIDDQHCRADEYCDTNNACLIGCGAHTDCSTSLCIDHVCSCTPDQGCFGDQVCDVIVGFGGTCVPSCGLAGTTGSCLSSLVCGPAGLCIPSCEDENHPCQENESCMNGICTTDGASG
jgi:hypothetical protein